MEAEIVRSQVGDCVVHQHDAVCEIVVDVHVGAHLGTCRPNRRIVREQRKCEVEGIIHGRGLVDGWAWQSCRPNPRASVRAARVGGSSPSPPLSVSWPAPPLSVSWPARPEGVAWPAPPVSTLAPALPVSVLLPAPPVTFSMP